MSEQILRLSEAQRDILWREKITADTCAHYFADLSYRYQRTQRYLTWAALVCSSGAVVVLLSDWLPAALLWIRSLLAVAVAAVSLWSLVGDFARKATDCSELHLRWRKLSNDLDALWCDMYAPGAQARLAELRERVADVGKSSDRYPNRESLMLKWQRRVTAQHLPA